MAGRPLRQRGLGQVSPCCQPWVLHLHREEMAVLCRSLHSNRTDTVSSRFNIREVYRAGTRFTRVGEMDLVVLCSFTVR